ncbi:hypothetical protein HOY82DRAFT_634168 [Tuber indicum]|nr:hypothetical protein HOY82DRAFT_634168 [Tuber indicum]
MDGFEAPRSVKYSVGTPASPDSTVEQTVWGDQPVVPLYIGMAATMTGDSTINIALSIHDHHCIINSFDKGLTLYLSDSNLGKFVGAGVTLGLDEICPGISPYIWKTLDIFCVLLKVQPRRCGIFGDTCINAAEQADSAALECIGYFDHDHNPIFRISSRNQVLPDADGAIKLVEDLTDYESTVHKHTWKTVIKYASELRGCNDGQTNGDHERSPVKIAFFSATPQGGGVALMRHPLVRFCSELGVDKAWYIPEADAEAFRITKTNHNILQGVANYEFCFDPKKHGSRLGGPLAPGGADVVVIDDPQMPALIPLIKEVRLEVKIIYRSHIEVRKDLVERITSSQEQVWKLDGLNKPLGEWDLTFYHRNLHSFCNEQKTNHLLYPRREYITQIERFDPSKRIPLIIESYRKLRDRIISDAPERLPPQWMVYAKLYATMKSLSRHAAIAKDVVVARIGPSDRIWNAMINTVKLVLQLFLREEFEVKIQHRKSGFLVEVGDTDSVANHLFDQYTDNDHYTKMSKHAKAGVSDEV